MQMLQVLVCAKNGLILLRISQGVSRRDIEECREGQAIAIVNVSIVLAGGKSGLVER